MAKYLLGFFSFLLECLFLNVIPFQYQNISYIFPSFVVIYTFLNYKLFNNKKEYFIFNIITSIVYGSIIMNNFLLGILLFSLIIYLTIFYNNFVDINILSIILGVILVIIIYNVSFYFIAVITLNVSLNFGLLFYKLKRSLIINIIYCLIVYLFFLRKGSKKLIC